MLLGAMRLWREAYRAHHCPAAALMPLFVGPRAAAIAPVHMVMAIMLLDAVQPLDIDASGTPLVGEGEAVFLALWRHCARGEEGHARATLALLLPAHLVDTALRAFAEAVTALSRAGIMLARLSHPPTRKPC